MIAGIGARTRSVGPGLRGGERAGRNGQSHGAQQWRLPLLSGGDINLNSLFVERASTIAKPDGVIGLLVPSGIATELASQKFFERLMQNKAVRCVFDFFNKRDNGELFFPDVYYRFKFCAFVFSPGERSFPMLDSRLSLETSST